MRLKYFSRKDGWDQYWEILDKKLPDEALYMDAMCSADRFVGSNKHLKYHSDEVMGSRIINIPYNLSWKWVFNSYLKKHCKNKHLRKNS